jgi:hypothetical protein
MLIEDDINYLLIFFYKLFDIFFSMRVQNHLNAGSTVYVPLVDGWMPPRVACLCFQTCPKGKKPQAKPRHARGEARAEAWEVGWLVVTLYCTVHCY